jgi:hypothetical protein
MKTWKIATGIACCLCLVAGCCTMCQDPYVHCGPVWSQGASLNCNPDYRAGSILNRPAPGALAAQSAAKPVEPIPQVSQSAPRATPAAPIAAKRSEELEHRASATALDHPRPISTPAPPVRQARQQPKSRDVPAAPSPNDLRLETAPAPPGTKEGDTRILSVTDRRLDGLIANPKPQ